MLMAADKTIAAASRDRIENRSLISSMNNGNIKRNGVPKDCDRKDSRCIMAREGKIPAHNNEMVAIKGE
jgi:hypothetical protein